MVSFIIYQDIIAQERNYHFFTTDIAILVLTIGMALFRYGNLSNTLAGYWFLIKQTVFIVVGLYALFLLVVMYSA